MATAIAKRCIVALFSQISLFFLVWFVSSLLPGTREHSEEITDKAFRALSPLAQYSSLDFVVLTRHFFWSFQFGLFCVFILFLITATVIYLFLISKYFQVFFDFVSAGIIAIPLVVLLPPIIDLLVVRFKWAPLNASVGGWSWLLPAILVSLRPCLKISRSFLIRLTSLENSDVTRTHQAMGFSDYKIKGKWLLKPALYPAFSTLASLVPEIFLGSFLIEIFFLVPGLGSLMLGALNERHLLQVSAVTLILGFYIILSQLVSDLVLRILDPRIRGQS